MGTMLPYIAYMDPMGSGFTQLENGGSFHSYVNVYQRVYDCRSPGKPWKTCVNRSVPAQKRWYDSEKYLLVDLHLGFDYNKKIQM